MHVISPASPPSLPPRRLISLHHLPLQFDHHLPQEPLIPLIRMLRNQPIRLLPRKQITNQFSQSPLPPACTNQRRRPDLPFLTTSHRRRSTLLTHGPTSGTAVIPIQTTRRSRAPALIIPHRPGIIRRGAAVRPIRHHGQFIHDLVFQRRDLQLVRKSIQPDQLEVSRVRAAEILVVERARVKPLDEVLEVFRVDRGKGEVAED